MAVSLVAKRALYEMADMTLYSGDYAIMDFANSETSGMS